MTYTEIKERNEIKYYYRVRSIRIGKKFRKQRIYLGKDLLKKNLILKEGEADKKLNIKNLRALNKIIPKIRRILKENKIKKAGIFGSYVTGRFNKKSDVDILIKYRRGLGFGFTGIQLDLEEKLGKKVHLVTYKSIHPKLKKQILKEEVKII